VRDKPTRTRDELVALIMERLKSHPDCAKVTGVVIAPIPRALSATANWRQRSRRKRKRGCRAPQGKLGARSPMNLTWLRLSQKAFDEIGCEA